MLNARQVVIYTPGLIISVMGSASTALTITTGASLIITGILDGAAILMWLAVGARYGARRLLHVERERTREVVQAAIDAAIDDLRIEVLTAINEANARAAQAETRADNAEARVARVTGINDLLMERYHNRAQRRPQRHA